MREKLERVRPATIGQASRIPGVTPAALSLVHVSIKIQGKVRGGFDGTRRAAGSSTG
jgi:tRNA uridine 5-carboxymethylaminomethyl modification enzyme